MKFKKPERWCDFSKFFDSLPDSFEIVPEGHVCVKWPEELTRERLIELVGLVGKIATDSIAGNRNAALLALADIAPVEKKRRRMAAWTNDYFTHPQLHPIDWFPERAERGNWRKVGECEVEA